MRTKQSAVAYLRVSGRGQVDGDGIERQRRAVQQFAKRNGLELVREFSDVISGTTAGEDRPALGELLDTLGEIGATVVVVERGDRLARDLVQGELILEALRRRGVRVLSADGGVDLTAGEGDPTATLVRQLIGAVAQFDKACIVRKLRAARDRKRAETGRCEGVKPFGSLPGEAEALEALQRLARKAPDCDRPTMAEVARKANELGIRSRSGRPWSRGTVWKILGAA